MTENDYINELAKIITEEYYQYENTSKPTRAGFYAIKSKMYALINQYLEEGKITETGYKGICQSLERTDETSWNRARWR